MRRSFEHQFVQIDPAQFRLARIAADGSQNLLQALRDGAERLPDFAEHRLLIAAESVGIEAAGDQIVRPDEEILDVVGVRARP